jgi:hypothetical protein
MRTEKLLEERQYGYWPYPGYLTDLTVLLVSTLVWLALAAILVVLPYLVNSV